MENKIPFENNLFNHCSGIVIEEGAKEAFLYLCGIDLEKEIHAGKGIAISPTSCAPAPNDMIDSIMGSQNGTEFDLGLLISTLRSVTAEVHISGESSQDVAIETWNAQTTCVLIAAYLNCEISWYFQCSNSASAFSASSIVHRVVPNMYSFPSSIRHISSNECSKIENVLPILLELNQDQRFSRATNALWSYRMVLRPAIKLSILWGGIESLFLIERGIKENLSKCISRTLAGDDSLVSDIRELYSLRSKAVHELENDTSNAVCDSASLLNSLIKKCTEEGCLPDIKDLLLLSD